MYVYGLKAPQKEFELKDRIAEAICFSLLNFVVVWLPVDSLLRIGWIQSYRFAGWLVVVAGFVIAPVLWPFALVWLLHRAEARGWIAVRAKTAWDDFFNRQTNECWVQVELLDGKVV